MSLVFIKQSLDVTTKSANPLEIRYIEQCVYTRNRINFIVKSSEIEDCFSRVKHSEPIVLFNSY